jgi:hypothetical protein
VRDRLQSSEQWADDGPVQVPIGESARFGPEIKPTHLVIRVAEREALACTGGQAVAVRGVPFGQALQSLECGDCRRRWRKIMKLPRPGERMTSESASTS